jgi:hypothetical protein
MEDEGGDGMTGSDDRCPLVPTVGRYADLPTDDITDRVVLDAHNGVPTVVVFEVRGRAVLGWMPYGHAQAVSLWTYVPLTDAEAEEVIERPPSRLDVFLAKRPGRAVSLALTDDGVIEFVHEDTIPQVSYDNPASSLAASALDAAERVNIDNLPESAARGVSHVRAEGRELVHA